MSPTTQASNFSPSTGKIDELPPLPSASPQTVALDRLSVAASSTIPIEFEAVKTKTSACKRICKLAYLALSIVVFPIGIYRLMMLGVRIIVGRILINNKSPWNEERFQAVVKTMKGRQLYVKTKDKAQIHAVHYKGLDLLTQQEVAANQRTVIICNAMGGYGYEYADLIAMYRNAGYNVLSFDYRSNGKSKGLPTIKGALLDAKTLVEYVHKKLEVPISAITLHGHSLGAGIALATARKTKTNACHERSYLSLSQAAREQLGGCKGWCASLFIKLSGSQLNCEKEWKQMTGRKYLIYHPQDAAAFTRLAQRLKSKGLLKPEQVVELEKEGTNPNRRRYEEPHSRTFTYEEEQKVLTMLSR